MIIHVQTEDTQQEELIRPESTREGEMDCNIKIGRVSPQGGERGEFENP